MDGSRFDGITRVLAADVTRRRTLLGLASGLIGGVLGFAGGEEASAACVKPGKKGCKGEKNGKCCKGARCQGGNSKKEGRCKCKGGTKQCGSDCVNTKSDKSNCGRCNKKCAEGHTCEQGVCTSALGCRAGSNACLGDDTASCSDTGNPWCYCITDIEGTPRCSDFFFSTCQQCESHADCPDGLVCFDAGSVADCGCPQPGGPGSGNACVLANCDEVSGSGGIEAAGRRHGPHPSARR